MEHDHFNPEDGIFKEVADRYCEQFTKPSISELLQNQNAFDIAIKANEDILLNYPLREFSTIELFLYYGSVETKSKKEFHEQLNYASLRLSETTNQLSDNINQTSYFLNKEAHNLGIEPTKENIEKVNLLRQILLVNFHQVDHILSIVNDRLIELVSKANSISSAQRFKFEFKSNVYRTGITIAKRLRDELSKFGFIDSTHQNSSYKNFQKLFYDTQSRSHNNADPIIWTGSYPQLYYLISQLTKNVIVPKHTLPSHIDVAREIFRDKSIDKKFTTKTKRVKDAPADKNKLDQIIKSVETQIVNLKSSL